MNGYREALDMWSRQRLKVVRAGGCWTSILELKRTFEIEHSVPDGGVPIKTFSLILSDLIGLKTKRGGPKKDRMGFSVILVEQ